MSENWTPDDTNEFDDSILRDRLQRLASHHVDDDAAYPRLTSRVRVAKRRRTATALSVVGAACLLVVGAATFLNRDSQSIAPAASNADDDPEITDNATTVNSTNTSAPSTTEPTTTSEPTTSSSAETTPPTPLDTEPTAPVGTPGTSSATNPAAPTAPPTSNGETRVLDSDGGSITVQLKNGTLTILSFDPDPGYQPILDKNEPTRLRVLFKSDGQDHRIDVRVINGVMFATNDTDQVITINTFDFPNSNDDHSGDGRDGRDGSGDDRSGSGHDGSGDDGSGHDGSGSGSGGDSSGDDSHSGSGSSGGDSG